MGGPQQTRWIKSLCKPGKTPIKEVTYGQIFWSVRYLLLTIQKSVQVQSIDRKKPRWGQHYVKGSVDGSPLTQCQRSVVVQRESCSAVDVTFRSRVNGNIWGAGRREGGKWFSAANPTFSLLDPRLSFESAVRPHRCLATHQSEDIALNDSTR